MLTPETAKFVVVFLCSVLLISTVDSIICTIKIIKSSKLQDEVAKLYKEFLEKEMNK